MFRENWLEQKAIRHRNSHIGTTKAFHNTAMDKSLMAMSNTNTDVMLRLAMQCWLRVALEQAHWRTRNHLNQVAGQAERLKYLNKTGVGAIVSRVALSATSVSLLTCFTLWQSFLKDSKADKEAAAVHAKHEAAQLKLLGIFLVGIIRKAFAAWRHAYREAQQAFLEEMKNQLSSQAEEASANQHQLRTQVGGLQHQLAVQLLAAEHNVEETHSHSFHLGSCVEELRGHTASSQDTLSQLEKELANFEAQLTESPLYTARSSARAQYVKA